MGNYYLKKITLDDEMNRRGQTLAIDLAGWIVQVDKIYLLKYTYFFNYDIQNKLGSFSKGEEKKEEK